MKGGYYLEKYKEILEKVQLFQGITWEELKRLLGCLECSVKKYRKDEYIVLEGEELYSTGIILSGSAEIIKENLSGGKAILSFLDTSDIFGEVIVCTQNKKSLVSILSKSEVDVMYINFHKIVDKCSANCGYHTKLISNMLKIIAEKNLMLNKKMDYILIKSMREKLSTFIFNKYKETKSYSFNIGINRNMMADYLNVSRASMCRELSNMKKEGIIDYYKDSFKILDLEKLRGLK